MAARTLPTAPNWVANQEVTSTLLNQISSYMTFWANPPSFRIEQHTVQSIANAATVQVTCETTIHDSDSGLQTTSPYAYVIPFAGTWDLFGGVGYAASGSGGRIAEIWQNGAAINGSQPAYAASGLTVAQTEAPGVICNVGDVIALYTYQSSGAALNTSTGATCSWLTGRLVSLNSP